ncbi:MAG: UDP-N-acetylmuramoyl-tripeptide--D-alanyl-D-alanine ligase [Kangiellaceae bacterium]|jgi:UDP-N-acetylmuramoyl-tripeptide--D-alanyl-D-alanine ligase|nr:UDP-N-acetylmuramoyl-tripeptide--D-alanyl-D-alanine ligase [Kangiellaceae bacterium]
MIALSLQKIAEVTGGELVGDNVSVSAICTDTRSLEDNSLFVAIKGEHFDAHDVLESGPPKDITAALVSRLVKLSAPQVLVEDTLIAFADIANYLRRQSTAKVIGLTGSVGKTTVKEMIFCILSNVGKTLATKGNLNNHIGVPLTLSRIDDDTEYCVIEMGANHPGEIAYLSKIVEPDIALINNAAAAHLEGFGSLQGVARAKGEIYQQLREGAVSIVNLDDDFSSFWLSRINGEKILFSSRSEADVYAENMSIDEHGYASFDVISNGQSEKVQLGVIGAHNIQNALASIACCVALNIPLPEIVEGISQFKGVSGRLERVQLDEKLLFINDSYNANYQSLRSAVDIISTYQEKKLLVLGDMGELGDTAREYHELAGVYAREHNIDYLLTVGTLSQFASKSFGTNAYHFNSKAELAQKIIDDFSNDKVIVLLKGSRSSRMEEIIDLVKDNNNKLERIH